MGLARNTFTPQNISGTVSHGPTMTPIAAANEAARIHNQESRDHIIVMTTIVGTVILMGLWVGALVAYRNSDYLAGLIMGKHKPVTDTESPPGSPRRRASVTKAVDGHQPQVSRQSHPEIIINAWSPETVMVNSRFGQDVENYRRVSQWQRDCPNSEGGGNTQVSLPPFVQIFHDEYTDDTSPLIGRQPKRSLSSPELTAEADALKQRLQAEDELLAGMVRVPSADNVTTADMADVFGEINDMVQSTQYPANFVYDTIQSDGLSPFASLANKRFSVGNELITRGFEDVDRYIERRNSRHSLANCSSPIATRFRPTSKSCSGRVAIQKASKRAMSSPLVETGFSDQYLSQLQRVDEDTSIEDPSDPLQHVEGRGRRVSQVSLKALLNRRPRMNSGPVMPRLEAVEFDWADV